MYETNHTIVAISSPPGMGAEAIVRISGPNTFSILKRLFRSEEETDLAGVKGQMYSGKLRIEERLAIDARIYAFTAPNSYNGDDIAELHIQTNPSVVEEVVKRIKAAGARGAGPGEFTARAYLNGKMDLTQAEAVAEVVASSNKAQLAAAEKLLDGKLSRIVRQIRQELLDVMSLIEAGLDFAEEDVEFISKERAVEAVSAIRTKLETLLANHIQYEEMVELSSVAIAGPSNAGKSRLLNALLGAERSIVSAEKHTTRDVLTGILKLEKFDCVLFDCAGLKRNAEGIIEELAQSAAIEAIRKACLVILCVDITKDNYSEDKEIIEMIQQSRLLPVATKCDLLNQKELNQKMSQLEKLVGVKLIKTSAKTGQGIDILKGLVDEALSELRPGGTEVEGQFAVMQRHRQAVSKVLDNIYRAVEELKLSNEEVSAMFLRAAYQALGPIETESIDETVLEQIFSRFCIGK